MYAGVAASASASTLSSGTPCARPGSRPASCGSSSRSAGAAAAAAGVQGSEPSTESMRCAACCCPRGCNAWKAEKLAMFSLFEGGEAKTVGLRAVGVSAAAWSVPLFRAAA